MKAISLFTVSLFMGFNSIAITADDLSSFALKLCINVYENNSVKCSKKTMRVADRASFDNADLYRIALERCFPEGDEISPRHSLTCLQTAQKLWAGKPVDRNLRLCSEFSDLGNEKKISSCYRRALNCEISFPSLQSGLRGREKKIEENQSKLSLDKKTAEKRWLTETLREVTSSNAAQAKACIEETRAFLKKQPVFQDTTHWSEAAQQVSDQLTKTFPTVTTDLHGTKGTD